MKNTLATMRSRLFERLIIACLIGAAIIAVTLQAAQAAPDEEPPELTSEDTLKLEDVPGAGTMRENPNAGVITMSDSLELIVEDATQNALANVTVDILYSDTVVGTGVTGSDGRMTITGLSKSVSFTIAATHEAAGKLTLEYDGAVSGFDDTVVLTLPETAPSAPTGFFAKLVSQPRLVVPKVISVVMLILAALQIARIIMAMAWVAREKRKTNEQIELRIEQLDNSEAAQKYKYAKRK